MFVVVGTPAVPFQCLPYLAGQGRVFHQVIAVEVGWPDPELFLRDIPQLPDGLPPTKISIIEHGFQLPGGAMKRKVALTNGSPVIGGQVIYRLNETLQLRRPELCFHPADVIVDDYVVSSPELLGFIVDNQTVIHTRCTEIDGGFIAFQLLSRHLGFRTVRTPFPARLEGPNHLLE